MRAGLLVNGSKLGVVGLGGLGQMALKVARARGAAVTVITGTVAHVIDCRRFKENNEDDSLLAKAGL